MEPRRRWLGGWGSPARRIGPDKQHPFPSPSLSSTPTRPRPRPAATAPSGSRPLGSGASVGGGREGGALEPPPRSPETTRANRPCGITPPPSPTTERASPGAQPMETEPGKKGARVRMSLRKAMLPAQGQRLVPRGSESLVLRALLLPLLSLPLSYSPTFFFSGN